MYDYDEAIREILYSNNGWIDKLQRKIENSKWLLTLINKISK